jgi:lipopolysaccharide/colanic/teichoic acid biosynthesis glycosyltransferase
MSISELPQLWNVFRGEMSLVGPRPEGPARAEHYSEWQQQRLAVRPGMTGLAQVQGLRERHSSEDKTRFDLQYILRPSLLKDVALLIETMWTLLLRLIKIPECALRAEGWRSVEPARHSTSSSANLQAFQEIFQNAHRTQSGSD